MSSPAPGNPQGDRRNRTVAAVCVVFFSTMLGASFAAVPLYDLFCRVTGYGGTTQRVEQYSDKILDREIAVRFDANVANGIPWTFKPVQREVKLRIGETAMVSYEARNDFGTPTAGRATFNVTPQVAGAYFMKVECFCFTDTTLQPGETMDMPVVFYVDPAIVDVPELKNIGTITLSYTFYPMDVEKSVAAGKGGAASGTEPNSGG